MKIRCTEEEVLIFRKISDAASELSMAAFIIGGFVRDKILNRDTKDADIVCDGDGIQLAQLVASQFSPKPSLNVFKNFGTAQLKIFLNENTFEIEFVGARKESYNHASRKPDVLPGTLEEDRLRRDFTINTIAASLQKNNFLEIIDPLNGVDDIKNKIIRTPLPPVQTFIDDPLRMMRAIRFAAQLNFEIAPETFVAIKKNASRIKIVSGERIIDELNKIVMTKQPSIGFNLLYTSGLLEIIFPQMIALAGAEFIDGK
ncbi:MAG TPA: CCA tRNA nucleotidyltransferase, partial [Hanamia sp.]|nr:CCA tRNA nucleotidyltransferase [Hanamia sp.]